MDAGLDFAKLVTLTNNIPKRQARALKRYTLRCLAKLRVI